jgi:hypothetical protein
MANLQKMRMLFLFLDGIGLDKDDPTINPFSQAAMPVLTYLLDGRRLLSTSAPFQNKQATLLAIDATMGVKGLPQSATGQAVLLTGINIPKLLGYHYGPKPNPEITKFLRDGNIFHRLQILNLSSALVNAYPPRYFENIQTGRRLYSAFPLALSFVGIPLKTLDDLKRGKAISADFTSQGWRDHLGIMDVPVLSPILAGSRLAELSRQYHFSLFEYWLSDYAGHNQDMSTAIQLLETFDQVLGGLLDNWNFDDGMILITSDHGNMEDLSTRRHTTNPVPLLMIGSQNFLDSFQFPIQSLVDVNKLILKLFKA